MKPTKKQKSNEEIVQAIDFELTDEQLEATAGGIFIPIISIPIIRPGEDGGIR